MDKKRSILAIGAHPDDVEIGCGGALAKHSAQGDRILILTLSRGERGGDAECRSKESVRSAKMIGATLRLEDLSDGEIKDEIPTIAAIQNAISACQPTHIYTPAFEDTHQDHRNVHLSTLAAAREIPNIYCYQTPSSTVDFRPNLFVDISDYLQTKLDLIAAHESQSKKRRALDPELLRATACYWGRFAGGVLVEPMTVFRQGA